MSKKIVEDMRDRLPGAESIALPAAIAWELIDIIDSLEAQNAELHARELVAEVASCHRMTRE